jgi:nucleoside-diphosphate-sugar epimerase
MSNVVMTGGYGFIGSHLVSDDPLRERGDAVTPSIGRGPTRGT